MIPRSPRPSAMPTWLSEEELQYYIQEFTRTGFAGGLHWYQTMDLNAQIAPQSFQGKTQIEQPCLFIAGENDGVITMSGGKDKVTQLLQSKCSRLSKCVFYPNAGHWIQQEQAAAVNTELIAWLNALDQKAVLPGK